MTAQTKLGPMGPRSILFKGRKNRPLYAAKLETDGWKTMKDLPWELRGPVHNRFGGHQMQRLRGFPATGKSGPGRRLTRDEIALVEEDLRRRGLIN